MINPEFIQITVAHNLFLDSTIKFIKMLPLKFFEINLDIYLEIKVFIIGSFTPI